MRDGRGLHEGLLGVLRVPEIAFEIDERWTPRSAAASISAGRQLLRRAEIGVHGALAVRRHQDVGAAGRGTVGRGPGLERDAGGADVVGVETADLVVPDLADIGGAGAEIGEADDGVGRRAAGHLGRRAHVAVDRSGARLVDQRHAALGHAVSWPENPRRSAPARRKSHCRSRERRISLRSLNGPVVGDCAVAENPLPSGWKRIQRPIRVPPI